MADPLTGLLQQKKEHEAKERQSATQAPKAPVKGLFDFDVGTSLSKSSPKNAGKPGATVGERLFEALAAGSTVDFPMVTEICERVAKEPREAPEAVRLLAQAFSERGSPPRRKLKALTIANELMYDPRAVAEFRQVHRLRDALWNLQATNGTGLGDGPDEQIRMFATEVEKKCFGVSGDPFAPLVTPSEDPFTLAPVAHPARPAPTAGYSSGKESGGSSGSSMMGALWQMGSASLEAAKEAANSSASLFSTGGSHGSRSRPDNIPRLPPNPGATRPTLEINFEGMLAGEKVHHAIGQAYLLTSKPFRETQGRLLITNFRLKFQAPKGSFKDELAWVVEKQVLDVPLGLIEAVRLESATSEAGAPEWKLHVETKDFRCLTILVPQPHDLALVEEAVGSMSQPGATFTSVLFAFQHAEAAWTARGGERRDEGWSIYDPVVEYERMGVDATPASSSSPWVISNVNRDYGLCQTYPACLVEPRGVQDQDLRDVASFRKRGRIPTMSWCGGQNMHYASLWRCSQPTEGLMGNACNADEKLLNAIRRGSPAGQNRELLVLDLRPKKAAYANKVGGGGFESYSGCRLVFGGIDNVHGVRDGWKKIGQAVTSLSCDEVGSWFKDVANSGWYDIIGAILNCARTVVMELDTHRCNAVIHCSDGWDRTAQVSSVAMLCLDPNYRTVRGLLILIQKEFCSFGHRFRTRLGNGEKPTSEYSPILLQWFECVYQLILQFPTSFEFSSGLLLCIGREALTNRYGTFLVDSEKERTEKVAPRTLSFWSEILNAGPAAEHVNPKYIREERVLKLSSTQVNFKLWEEYWFRHHLHPREELCGRQPPALS